MVRHCQFDFWIPLSARYSCSSSVIISIFMISGFTVRMVAVVFVAVFVSVVMDKAKDAKMKGNDLRWSWILF